MDKVVQMSILDFYSLVLGMTSKAHALRPQLHNFYIRSRCLWFVVHDRYYNMLSFKSSFNLNPWYKTTEVCDHLQNITSHSIKKQMHDGLFPKKKVASKNNSYNLQLLVEMFIIHISSVPHKHGNPKL